MESGLPPDYGIERLGINKKEKNTYVTIEGLDTIIVQKIIKTIHFPDTNKKFFDVPLYCKPLRNMTTVKNSANVPNASDMAYIDNDNKPESNSKVENQLPPEHPMIPGLPESECLKH